MNFFKKLFKKIAVFKANRSFVGKRIYLTNQGAKIGAGTRLLCDISSFGSEPYLISVGENCLFSAGIKIFTHDGGVSVLNNLDYFEGKRVDKIARVNIGDNVYIGTGAFILPGVTIGNNCIIGAGSIVSKDIPDNSVAAGVPAKIIKSLDEYYQSAKDKGLFYPTASMGIDEKRAFFSRQNNE